MSTVMQSQPRPAVDPLVIAGVEYRSRLLVGTGKYKDLEETRAAIEASGAEIVTVAIRRTNIGQRPGEPNLLEVISPERYTLLPNTAGCYTAEDAVRTCRLARELLDGHELVKLEVLGDEKTLFPDILETIKATEILVKEGQQVTKGQKIAEMGNTDADQVKLHFEIRRLGKPVDPARYLPAG